MAIPDYQAFMRPVLLAFSSGAGNVREALPEVIRELGITEEEASELLPSGRKTVVADRAHWARTYLSKAGLLESPHRNAHRVTDRGREYLARYPDRIDNAVLASVDEFEDWRTRRLDGEVNSLGTASALDAAATALSAETPEALIEKSAQAIEDALAEELLSAVLGLSPQRFEDLIVDLLLAMGYGGGDSDMGSRIGKSGDGGIDGVINEDKLGLDAVYVQAKRYGLDNKVGRPALQAFVGSLTGESASKGVFVTTSDFSKEARDYVNRVQQRIVLINGDRLARLMIAHEVGVRARRAYVVRSVDEDYFAEPE